MTGSFADRPRGPRVGLATAPLPPAAPLGAESSEETVAETDVTAPLPPATTPTASRPQVTVAPTASPWPQGVERDPAPAPDAPEVMRAAPAPAAPVAAALLARARASRPRSGAAAAPPPAPVCHGRRTTRRCRRSRAPAPRAAMTAMRRAAARARDAAAARPRDARAAQRARDDAPSSQARTRRLRGSADTDEVHARGAPAEPTWPSRREQPRRSGSGGAASDPPLPAPASVARAARGAADRRAPYRRRHGRARQARGGVGAIGADAGSRGADRDDRGARRYRRRALRRPVPPLRRRATPATVGFDDYLATRSYAR